MSKLSCKFGESKWNPCWVIVLTSSSAIKYVPYEHDDINQNPTLLVTFDVTSLYTNVPLEEARRTVGRALLHSRQAGELICNTIQDNAMLKLTWKFSESKWNPCCVIVLTSSSGINPFFTC